MPLVARTRAGRRARMYTGCQLTRTTSFTPSAAKAMLQLGYHVHPRHSETKQHGHAQAYALAWWRPVMPQNGYELL